MVWLLYFCIGVIVLLLSTHALIKLTEKLSTDLRISPLIIGATVVALGTSLPELAVSSIASARHDVGLALGNTIGSVIALPAKGEFWASYGHPCSNEFIKY